MRFLFYILILFISSKISSQTLEEIRSARSKININQDWLFSKNQNSDDPKKSNFDDADWELVYVPHTFKLSSNTLDGVKDDATQPTFHRYIGWYRKQRKINYEEGQQVFLEFEGAHQVTTCYVNGTFVGQNKIGGYNPFSFNITPFLKPSGQQNMIVLKVDNRVNKTTPPDGDQMDYVKWSGLYRDVYLVKTNPTYITFNWESKHGGIFITTPSVTKRHATINVKSQVRNTTDKTKKITVTQRVIDKNGTIVARISDIQEVLQNQAYQFNQTLGIHQDLQRWSPDNPYLYRVQTLVFSGNKIVDALENKIGIRKIEFIDGRGMVLNDKPIELIGANRHQAYPFIGDAAPNALQRQDAIQFKALGFNVIRMAHYPHDDAFIQACDELGIFLAEEAPTWISMPRGLWMKNLEEATRIMIRNHRNSPSIFTWAAGMNHRGPVERLHEICKEEDPTRATGSNGSPWSGPRNAGAADIYTPMDYQNLPVTEDSFSFLCEHGSSADAYKNQFEVSKSRASKNRFGVAVWTAHDYLSFKKDWGLQPRRPFSLYRVPNPVSNWYKSELLDTPIVSIADDRASTATTIHVFANTQEVSLYNDGQLVATQRPDTDPNRAYCNHPSFTFLLPNTKGKLVAIGLNQGVEVARDELIYKNGKQDYSGRKLKIFVDEMDKPFEASGHDYRWVRAQLVDGYGQIITRDTTLITFSVRGNGRLIGDKKIGANPNKAYYGTASIFLASTKKPGSITITAKAKGVKPVSTSIQTVPYSPDERLKNIQPFNNFKKVRCDIGNTKQYGQFEWELWSDENKKNSNYTFHHMRSVSVTITPEKGDLTWTNSFGMSGELAYVAMDHVAVEKNDAILLTFKGLEDGLYKLKTYHHFMKVPKLQENIDFNKKQSMLYTIELADTQGKQIITTKLSPTEGIRVNNLFPASEEMIIHSKKGQEATIKIYNTLKTIPVLLNGFELKRIK